VACANARMHEWEVKTFEDLVVLHNRKTGSVGLNIFKLLFDDGKRNYNRGLMPSVHFLISIRVIFDYPMIIGSLIQLLGYLSLFLKREKLIFPKELQKFIKAEQKVRLRKMLKLR